MSTIICIICTMSTIFTCTCTICIRSSSTCTNDLPVFGIDVNKTTTVINISKMSSSTNVLNRTNLPHFRESSWQCLSMMNTKVSFLSSRSSNLCTSFLIRYTRIVILNFLNGNIVGLFDLLILNLLLSLHLSNWESLSSVNSFVLHVSYWNLIVVNILSWLHRSDGNLFNSRSLFGLE